MNGARLLWLAAAALAAVAAGSAGGCSLPPSRAWCANLDDMIGADCAYDTFEQCMASARGVSSGNCTQNPRHKAWRTRSRAQGTPK